MWKILIQNRNGQIVQVWNAFRNLGRRNLGWRSCPSPGHCFRNDLPGGKRAKKPDTERSANLPQGENVLRVSLFFFFFQTFSFSPSLLLLARRRGGEVSHYRRGGFHFYGNGWRFVFVSGAKTMFKRRNKGVSDISGRWKFYTSFSSSSADKWKQRMMVWNLWCKVTDIWMFCCFLNTRKEQFNLVFDIDIKKCILIF